jgi:hypothetical protein
LTDSTKSWAANRWGPANGHAYNVTNLTKGGSFQVSSSTATAAMANEQPFPNWLWNNGDVYIITGTTRCLDQGSAYGGQLFDPAVFNIGEHAAAPARPTTQVSDPSYEFKDVGPVLHGSFWADSLNVLHDRDYFTDGGNAPEWTTPGTALTSGVAWGKLANRPTSCASGVGYWAYDQGNWNQSGNSFGQGQLFVCGAANTWALHYTPYTYPHPLITGGTTTSPPSPPSGLTATVQ